MQNTQGQFLPLQSKLRQTNKQRRDFINVAFGKKEEDVIGLKQSANKKKDYKYWAGGARTHTETAIDGEIYPTVRKIGSPAEFGNLLSLIEHI